MDKYIGFDIACNRTVACVVQKGKRDKYDTLPTDVNVMRQWLGEQRKPGDRLSAPSSKRQLETWQKSVEGIESFGLHQYYRALDYLVDHKEALEKRIFSRMRDLFCADVDIILFDTTTVAYYGDSDEHEDLLEYGFSKIRRGDLKQIVVGVIMSKQGIPLGHEVFEGNRNDVTCFSEIINQVSEKYNVDRVIMVGDRGMISKNNIRHLEEKNYKYIFGYRMRTIRQEDRHKVFSEKEFRKLKSELEMGPIYQWKDRRIRAHVMICFLTFVLRTVFYKKLKKEDRNMSYTAIMADLKALRTCEVSVKGEKIKLRTELEPGAVKAFRAIGMRPPSHLLSKVTLEDVVIRQ